MMTNYVAVDNYRVVAFSNCLAFKSLTGQI